jgi:hypothetical protein
VHYGKENGRERAYRRLLVDGMCSGYAAEDGTGLHFVGPGLAKVVSSRPSAVAYRMRCADGRVDRRPLPTTYLGAEQPIAAAA